MDDIQIPKGDRKTQLINLRRFTEDAKNRLKEMEGQMDSLTLAADEKGLRQVLADYHSEEVFVDLLFWRSQIIAKRADE